MNRPRFGGPLEGRSSPHAPSGRGCHQGGCRWPWGSPRTSSQIPTQRSAQALRGEGPASQGSLCTPTSAGVPALRNLRRCSNQLPEAALHQAPGSWPALAWSVPCRPWGGVPLFTEPCATKWPEPDAWGWATPTDGDIATGVVANTAGALSGPSRGQHRVLLHLRISNPLVPIRLSLVPVRLSLSL